MNRLAVTVRWTGKRGRWQSVVLGNAIHNDQNISVYSGYCAEPIACGTLVYARVFGGYYAHVEALWRVCVRINMIAYIIHNSKLSPSAMLHLTYHLVRCVKVAISSTS